jgi:hypothetical protein
MIGKFEYKYIYPNPKATKINEKYKNKVSAEIKKLN